MIDNDFRCHIFNCTYEPAFTIQETCETMQKATGMHHNVPLVPAGLLMFVAKIIGPLGGKRWVLSDRVKKLMVSTNTCGKNWQLLDSSFTIRLKNLLETGLKIVMRRG